MSHPYDMFRRRRELCEHRHLRQAAVAKFPRAVMRAAEDLAQFCDRRLHGEKLSPEAEAAADYLEQVIRDEFRKCFGHELTQ